MKGMGKMTGGGRGGGREGGLRDEAGQRPLEFGLISRMLRYTRPYAAMRNTLVFLVVVRAALLSFVPWYLGQVINGPVSHGDWDGVVRGVLYFLLLSAVTDLMFRYRQLYALQIGEYVIHDLRNEVFRHIQRMPMAFFHKTKRGRIISRVTSDIGAMRQGVQNVLFVSIVQGLQMIGAGALMCYTNPVLFSIVVFMTPALWFLNSYFRRRMSEAGRAVQESFSRITSNLAESVSGIRVTQGFVRQETNMGLFRNLVEDHSKYNMGVARASSVFMPLLELNTQFFMAALVVLSGYGALLGGFDVQVGDLVTFFFLSSLFFSPIQNLGMQYNHALVAMAGAERVFKLLDTQPTWQDAPDARDLPALRGGVEFDHVTFSYEPGTPVLHDVSFCAEPGQTIALVGHTGSGKSSIINLLAKFYIPDSGAVKVDGIDLNTATGDSLHRQLGMVLQNNFLFTGSVMENIRLGRPAASDAEVRAAAVALDCLDLIEDLPEGFQTEVGEGGAGLSLGQRQIVCFVRAFLADPRILILDEATSAIDTITEARLQRALRKLVSGRTSFIVAHRLSTIRHADLVLVLDHGIIAERGSHDQLVEQNGIYADLYRKFIRLTGDPV